MAKRENDLTERTLGETLDGNADRFGKQDLGKLSKVKRAVRKPAPREAAPAIDPAAIAQAHYLQSINSDLRARDRKGQPIPSLAQRIAKEGYRAQFGKKKAVKPSGKTRKRAKVKRAKAR